MPDERPIAGYAVLATAYSVALASSLAAANRRRGKLSAPNALDLATGAFAVFKLSRVIAKDDIAAFIRAPFVTVTKPNDDGEVEEEPRGSGLQKAAGELVTCPHCLGMWTGGAVAVGYAGAPQLTRVLTSLLAAVAIADFLCIAYAAVES